MNHEVELSTSVTPRQYFDQVIEVSGRGHFQEPAVIGYESIDRADDAVNFIAGYADSMQETGKAADKLSALEIAIDEFERVMDERQGGNARGHQVAQIRQQPWSCATAFYRLQLQAIKRLQQTG